ncbi:MAG TPA: phosphotransferase family protein [Nocardioidaceae bacterium]|nr:phosphotransferase family protein [Nocardioidaceae bacterium]
MAPDVPGLDLDRLRDFLDDALPGMVEGSLRAELIAGGKSNLTYELGDGTRSWVVRRPPLGHVLATAHDMAREHTVMTALRDTDVPVPRTYVLCEDPGVVGAPFYVMEHVDGTPYRLASQLAALGPTRTMAISTRMVDTLATLHRVDPVAVGLSGFGRPEGFLARQVRRWKKQLDASRSRTLDGADELHDLLEVQLPVESPPGIVHGDFRLDNLLVDQNDEVAAVIDWEMATLGDPLTDVALLAVYQDMAALDSGYAVADASTADGFLSNEAMLERYAAGSERDLSAMGFYLGLAYFKLAVILEGIHYRYTQGQTVGEGFDTVGGIVEPLLSAGLTSMKERT